MNKSQREMQRELETLELQEALFGISADPSITLRIEDIKAILTIPIATRVTQSGANNMNDVGTIYHNENAGLLIYIYVDGSMLTLSGIHSLPAFIGPEWARLFTRDGVCTYGGTVFNRYVRS